MELSATKGEHTFMKRYRMRRLVVFALLLFTQQSFADCNSVISQSIKLEPFTGTAINYDPFAPQPAFLILSAEFDEQCERPPQARLYWRDSGLRSAKAPPLVMTQDGSLVFLTNGQFRLEGRHPANARPILFQLSGSGTLATATLQAMFKQRGHSTPAGKPGLGSIEIQVVITAADGRSLANSSQSVTLAVDTKAIGKLSLTDSIGHIGKPGVRELIGLGELNEAGVELQKNLWIWSNSRSVIEASSETNWLLLRKGHKSSKHSQIPFGIALTDQFGGDLLKSISGNDLRSTTLPETTVDGSRYELIVSVGEGASTGKRAGDYRGSITLTVRPRH